MLPTRAAPGLLARNLPVVVATALASMAWHMVMPFMALYLTRVRAVSPAEVGIVAGAGPLIQSIFGLVAGYLIDRWGAHRPVAIGLFLGAIGFVGLAEAEYIPWIFFIYVLVGGVRSVFTVGSRVLVSFATEASERLQVFGYLYIAFNVGAIAGPLLSGMLIERHPEWMFLSAALVQGLGFSMFLLMRGYSANHVTKRSIKGIRTSAHRAPGMIQVLLGNVVVWFAFAQVWVTIPQHLNSLGLASHYSLLLIINACLIVVLQAPLLRCIQSFGRNIGIGLGVCSLGGAFVAAAASTTPVGFYLMILLLTVAEMMLFPLNNAMVDSLVTDEEKGAAFGLFNLTMVGISLGAVVGSPALSRVGGTEFFLLVALSSPALALLYWSHSRAVSAKREDQHRLSHAVRVSDDDPSLGAHGRAVSKPDRCR